MRAWILTLLLPGCVHFDPLPACLPTDELCAPETLICAAEPPRPAVETWRCGYAAQVYRGDSAPLGDGLLVSVVIGNDAEACEVSEGERFAFAWLDRAGAATECLQLDGFRVGENVGPVLTPTPTGAAAVVVRDQDVILILFDERCEAREVTLPQPGGDPFQPSVAWDGEGLVVAVADTQGANPLWIALTGDGEPRCGGWRDPLIVGSRPHIAADPGGVGIMYLADSGRSLAFKHLGLDACDARGGLECDLGPVDLKASEPELLWDPLSSQYQAIWFGADGQTLRGARWLPDAESCGAPSTLADSLRPVEGLLPLTATMDRGELAVAVASGCGLELLRGPPGGPLASLQLVAGRESCSEDPAPPLPFYPAVGRVGLDYLVAWVDATYQEGLHSSAVQCTPR